jgi:Mg2+-importing ATPase
VLPFTGLGKYFGFRAPPPEFFLILAALSIAYLGIVEVTKRIFYAHFTTRPK